MEDMDKDIEFEEGFPVNEDDSRRDLFYHEY